MKIVRVERERGIPGESIFAMIFYREAHQQTVCLGSIYKSQRYFRVHKVLHKLTNAKILF